MKNSWLGLTGVILLLSGCSQTKPMVVDRNTTVIKKIYLRDTTDIKKATVFLIEEVNKLHLENKVMKKQLVTTLSELESLKEYSKSMENEVLQEYRGKKGSISGTYNKFKDMLSGDNSKTNQQSVDSTQGRNNGKPVNQNDSTHNNFSSSDELDEHYNENLDYFQEEDFIEDAKTYYVNTHPLKVKDTPFVDANTIQLLEFNKEVSIGRCNRYGWCELLEPMHGYVAKYLLRK